MKKAIIIFAVCSVALPVFAQTQPSMRDQSDVLENERQGVIESIREEIEQRQAEFKEMMATQRAVVKTGIDAKRADLRKRLATIRDERKKKLVEKIDAQMDALNERWMDHFSNVTDHLEVIVVKIEERTAQAETRGRDGSGVKNAVADAKSALAASRTAVATQAGKTYSIAVSTEDALRVEVGKARKALHDDLASVRDTVKNAREAVHKAAVALAQAARAENRQATTTPSAANNAQ